MTGGCLLLAFAPDGAIGNDDDDDDSTAGLRNSIWEQKYI